MHVCSHVRLDFLQASRTKYVLHIFMFYEITHSFKPNCINNSKGIKKWIVTIMRKGAVKALPFFRIKLNKIER